MQIQNQNLSKPTGVRNNDSNTETLKNELSQQYGVTFEDSDRAWNEKELMVIKDLLGRLPPDFVKSIRGYTFVRQSQHQNGSKMAGAHSTGGKIYIFDSAVDGKNIYGPDNLKADLGSVVVHEMAHAYDYKDGGFSENGFWNISGWKKAGDGKQTHSKEDANFAREYGAVDAEEDFATTFERFWMDQGGLKEVAPEKAGYISGLFKNGFTYSSFVPVAQGKPKVNFGFWGKIGGFFKKVGKKVGGAFKKVGKKVGGTVKKIAKKIGGVAKVVGKKVGGIFKSVGRTVKGVFRTVGSAFKLTKNFFSIFYSLFKGDMRGVTMGFLKTLGGIGQFVFNLGSTVLDGVATVARPFSNRAADKLAGWSDKLQNINQKIKDGLDLADQASHSIFYRGETLKPWEVKELPPQDGPKGNAVDINMEKFADQADGADVSELAKELLEKNAPIVRQYSHDTYPMSLEDMLKHADKNPDGTYDLHDSFADNPLASQAYKPKVYASATKVSDNLIKLTYTRYYPNSYISTGPNMNLPSEAWHEGDAEHSSFLYDISKGEIVAANVLKHGQGAGVWQHSQEQIEFINGRPVVTVALGSHATGITGGLEVAPTKDSAMLQRIFGKPAYDRYATRQEVASGRAIDLSFSPEDVIVLGAETSGTVVVGENDRWRGRIVGGRRHADYPIPRQKVA